MKVVSMLIERECDVLKTSSQSADGAIHHSNIVYGYSIFITQQLFAVLTYSLNNMMTSDGISRTYSSD
jgi:hypothetical protein